MRRFVIALLLPMALLSACEDKDSSAASAASGGDSGSSDTSSKAASVPEDWCTLVTADQISAIVGATVVTKTGPTGDCEFTQNVIGGMGGSVGGVARDDSNGGLDGYKTGTTSVLDGVSMHDLTGIGDDAFFVTGTFNGNDQLQGAGAAVTSGALVTVNLAQGQDLSDAVMTDVATKLLTLTVGAL